MLCYNTWFRIYSYIFCTPNNKKEREKITFVVNEIWTRVYRVDYYIGDLHINHCDFKEEEKTEQIRIYREMVVFNTHIYIEKQFHCSRSHTNTKYANLPNLYIMLVKRKTTRHIHAYAEYEYMENQSQRYT